MGYFIADNVNNNNICINELSIKFRFDPLYRHLRCIGYIINLVTCMLLFSVDLKALDKKEENEDEVLW